MALATGLPTGRRGQALAAGILAVLLLAVWLGVVLPVLGLFAARQQEIGDLRARSAREAALVAALPALSKQAQLAAKTPTRAVLPGNSDAIAGATLQEQVQAMATVANAQLTSIETLPAEQVGAYRRIGVRVELSAQLSVLTALLRAVEDAQPSMLVDDIRLTATPVGPQNAQLPLEAVFTVYAFRVGVAKEDQP